MKSTVRINASGCLDACEFGPVAVVYPEGEWYGHLEVEDCADLFESVIAGRDALTRRQIDHPRFNRKESEEKE